MEIQGLNRFIRTLNNASNNFDEEASKRLNNVSQKLVAKVKLKTPVDSGVLRRSWRVKSEGQLAKIIYTNTRYAPMVEFGHRTRGGKSFVDGRYMLTKSVEEIESELDNQLSILIENLWK
jgi:phage gpG-like protein